MNGINRRGQKVICIMELEIEDAAGNYPLLPIRPVPGEQYTVADFLDSGMVLEDQDVDAAEELPGIVLFEIEPIRGRDIVTKQPVVLGWPIIAFKPVDERETSIEMFTDLLEPVTEQA